MAKKNGHQADSLVREITGTMTVPMVDRSGVQIGTIDLDANEFGGRINRQLLHDVVLMYLANQRAGTHHTLRRGQVAGSTKKVFRQKGTGNARIGTKRTNKRVGGGTAKGPKPRDYEYHLPKRAVRLATRMALLSKFADHEVTVIDELSLPEPKTKDMLAILKAIQVPVVPGANDASENTIGLHETTVLIGTAQTDLNVYKSGRNLPGVRILPAAEFHTYMILRQKRLLLTRAALEILRAKQVQRRPVPVLVGNTEETADAS